MGKYLVSGEPVNVIVFKIIAENYVKLLILVLRGKVEILVWTKVHQVDYSVIVLAIVKTLGFQGNIAKQLCSAQMEQVVVKYYA